MHHFLISWRPPCLSVFSIRPELLHLHCARAFAQRASDIRCVLLRVLLFLLLNSLVCIPCSLGARVTLLISSRPHFFLSFFLPFQARVSAPLTHSRRSFSVWCIAVGLVRRGNMCVVSFPHSAHAQGNDAPSQVNQVQFEFSRASRSRICIYVFCAVFCRRAGLV